MAIWWVNYWSPKLFQLIFLCTLFFTRHHVNFIHNGTSCKKKMVHETFIEKNESEILYFPTYFVRSRYFFFCLFTRVETVSSIDSKTTKCTISIYSVAQTVTTHTYRFRFRRREKKKKAVAALAATTVANEEKMILRIHCINASLSRRPFININMHSNMHINFFYSIMCCSLVFFITNSIKGVEFTVI